MPAPINTFKQAIQTDRPLFGCWLSLADAGAAEMIGTAGFDWVLIDGEHSPNDIRSIRDQLSALQASDSPVIVRVPVGETWLIKQVLDVGAQTVMVPMVESAEQARELVRACTYPPTGTRGVGATAARAARFGGIDDYLTTADEQICLLVQVENRAGIANLDEILGVEGVDGVFIGPSDLSTDMGYKGDFAAPEVQAVIHDALRRIKAAGKSPGVMSLGDLTPGYLDADAQFIAVAIDVILMMTAARESVAKWKSG